MLNLFVLVYREATSRCQRNKYNLTIYASNNQHEIVRYITLQGPYVGCIEANLTQLFTIHKSTTNHVTIDNLYIKMKGIDSLRRLCH